MDIAKAEQLMRTMLDKASQDGFIESEACYSADSVMSLNILNGEVSGFESSDGLGISFRGKINGQMGYASSTMFDEDAVSFMLLQAKNNCEVLDDEDEEFIYYDENNKNLECIQNDADYSENCYDRFAKEGLALEKKLLASDSSIVAVDYLSIDCGTGPMLIINSKGLRSFRDSGSVSVQAEIRGNKDGVVKSAGNYWYGRSLNDFNADEFVSELKKRLLGKFGASSVKSGKYNVIIENFAFLSLLEAYMNVFSSYAMQKGLSLLSGKEGQKIASDCFTMTDDPFYAKALNKIPFDSEGVLTSKKDIIGNGVFNTALYNVKTARKEGRESTGNGFRGGYSGTIGISTTNLVIKNGVLDFDGLCKKAGNGIILTELNGLHAGVNSISGDFSLFCEGYLIENGTKSRPVEQITVSGNFFELLKSISAVGNDEKSLPDGAGESFSPSVLVDNLSIAGDEK